MVNKKQKTSKEYKTPPDLHSGTFCRPFFMILSTKVNGQKRVAFSAKDDYLKRKINTQKGLLIKQIFWTKNGLV